MAELWDLYDENAQLTGKTMMRGEEVPAGYYRQVVHLCIFNSKEEMLCQRRALEKIGFGGYWDVTVGGCMVAGETVFEAMKRELSEELGLVCDFTEQERLFVLKGDDYFDNYFFLIADIDLSSITLQKEEVMDVAYYSFEEIDQMIQEDKFIPYGMMELIKKCKDAIFQHNS